MHSKPVKARLPDDRRSDAAKRATLSQRSFSPSKLATLIEVASESGLDLDAVLTGTGLDLDAIANPFILTSTQQFLTAVRNAIRQYGNADLGLRVGSLLRVSSCGMFGYAVLCSESMAHAFDLATKFQPLVNNMLDIRWIRQGDMASWIFSVRDEIMVPELDTQLYHFLIDMQFVSHVKFIKDVMGDWCVPTQAQFTRARPAHAALLSETLECPLEFDWPCNMLSYPTTWLPRAPQLAHSITAAQVSAHCACQLEELRSQSDITQWVYHELTRTPGRFPEIDAIADDLSMTARTLRRKLEAAGTSYSELLTGVRRALAMDYLSTTTLSAENIAQALGFSDVVSFRHAFKHWTGKTPGEVRGERKK